MLRQMYVTQPLVASNFAKNRENTKGELCLYVFIPFSSILSKPKWGEGGAQATVREAQPPGPPVATALLFQNTLTSPKQPL